MEHADWSKRMKTNRENNICVMRLLVMFNDTFSKMIGLNARPKVIMKFLYEDKTNQTFK